MDTSCGSLCRNAFGPIYRILNNNNDDDEDDCDDSDDDHNHHHHFMTINCKPCSNLMNLGFLHSSPRG